MVDWAEAWMCAENILVTINGERCVWISLGFDLNLDFHLWGFDCLLFRLRGLVVSRSFLKVVVGYFVGIRCEFVTPPTLHSCHTASKTQPIGFLGKWISALIFCIQNPVSCMMCSYSIFDINKTISDGGITIDLWIIKVYTSNWSSNSWGSWNSWGSSNSWGW